MGASKGSRRSGRDAKAAPVPAGTSRAGKGDAEVARLERLLQLMREHDLVELEIGPDGQSVRMSKTGSIAVAAPERTAHAAPAPIRIAPVASKPAEKPAIDGEPFLSPMVGTFYRAPSPEAKPFVAEGDLVKPDTTLCMIEAMKVMNEIKAERAGKIVQILAENGEAVEYGQPLFVIQKAD